MSFVIKANVLDLPESLDEQELSEKWAPTLEAFYRSRPASQPSLQGTETWETLPNTNSWKKESIWREEEGGHDDLYTKSKTKTSQERGLIIPRDPQAKLRRVTVILLIENELRRNPHFSKIFHSIHDNDNHQQRISPGGLSVCVW